MKNLTIVLFVFVLGSCNKKAEIVELIKKTKNEWYEAEMNRGAYKYVATKLLSYNHTLASSKVNGGQLMKGYAQISKEAYDTAVQQLKRVAPNVSETILKDQKKLDSIALVYEKKTWSLQHKLDSLELELKKY